jgi:tyrosyl-tRNA synthetase
MLQGYDSVAMDVDLEIGGTDQTFNMMMGRHLQRVYNDHEKWVLTTPIINGTDGRKMSKSYGNFVALTENPTDMYGKLMRISDDMIIEYFTVLTDVPMTEIGEMETAIQKGANPMEFKKQLAKTITTMYHDAAAAQAAQEHFEKTIQNKEIPDESIKIAVSSDPISLLNLTSLALPEESKSNLRRFIEQSAVELLPSGEKPTDPNQMVDPTAIKNVRIGKRRYFTIVVE